MGFGGAPTKYKPEYCQLLIEHMDRGFSFESFAAECDVCFDTLYEWVKVHPEFSEAKRKATAKGMRQWEKMGMSGMLGEIMNFNSGTWIFNMKNRFKWTDRLETKETNITGMTKEELMERAKELLNDLEKK